MGAHALWTTLKCPVSRAWLYFGLSFYSFCYICFPLFVSPEATGYGIGELVAAELADMERDGTEAQ